MKDKTCSNCHYSIVKLGGLYCHKKNEVTFSSLKCEDWRKQGEEVIINNCENCHHFNELIHWDEGLFYQCMHGNKLWEKCSDYDAIR